MANITAYPTGTVKASDLILGTSVPLANTDDFAVTQNFTASSISSLGVVYQSYTALLTQTGTNAPVATVLNNTTGGTITWTRTGSGAYTATIADAVFTENKTVVFANPGIMVSNDNSFGWARTNDTQIAVSLSTDGRVTDGSFEIRIY